MTFGLSGAALAGIAVAGATVYSANKAAGAAEDASAAQVAAGDRGINEQQRQFDAIQKLLSPFVTPGTKAIGAQGDLIGLNGAAPQQTAIDALKGSPEFAALSQQGEDAILANASATGGLRGGNTEAALAQFRPQLLAQLINEQYGRLGGLTSIGQNAAAGVGNAGISTGNTITQLLQQQGAATAGGALAQGQAAMQIPNALLSGFGVYRGLGGKF